MFGAIEQAGRAIGNDAPAHQDRLRLRLIGQMSASHRSAPVALPKGRKSRALLAILAMASPRPVLREQVTALLWSTREREQARASLRQCVHELQEMQRVAGLEILRSVGQTLQIMADRVWVDVQAVSTATIASADMLDLLPGDTAQAGLLEDLVGLDPAFDRWLASEGRRMRAAAAVLAGLLLEQESEPGATIIAGRRLVAIAPTHEGGWRRLIQAYAACGESAAATEAYEQCASALAAAGVMQPSEETRDVLARVGPVGTPAAGPAAMEASRRRGADQGGLRSVWLGVSVFRATDPIDDAILSVGLAEEITTALARFRWINLIAHGSITAMAHEPIGQTERWRGLDLDFLLDGTIQRSGGPDQPGRVRVTVRLLYLREGRAQTGGEVVWSARFDRLSADLFSLQDEIAAETAAQVDPQLMLHESRRAATRPMRDATAYELMLRAIPSIYRLAEPGFSEAGAMLARAAERAPDSATICAWWACWYAFLVGQGWAQDPAAAMKRAGELAERAVGLDPGCARALSVAGHVNSFLLHKDIEETIGLHDRALALNPNMPYGWAVAALSLSYAGEHATAILHGQRARLLSPFDPHSFFFDSVMMVPHLMLREYDVVATLGRRSLALNPGMSATYKGLLSALGHMGRDAEAAELRAKLQRIEPGFSLADAAARSPLRRVEDLQIYIEGLRRAGLPEAPIRSVGPCADDGEPQA